MTNEPDPTRPPNDPADPASEPFEGVPTEHPSTPPPDAVNASRDTDEAPITDGMVELDETPGTPAAVAATPADEGGSDEAEPPRQPRRRLTRSRRDVVIGGVAGGFAEYVDADPTLVRLAFIVLAFITAGAFLLVYFGALIVMPEGEGDPERETQRSRSGPGLGHGLFWGGVLILLGALLLLRQLDIELPSWDVFLAGALIVVGLLLVIESRRGLNGGLTVLAVILTILLGVSTALNVTIQGGFGDQNVTVERVQDLDSRYGHAFGSMTLDLRQVDFPEGTTNVSASVVFGSLEVRLPDDVGVLATSTTVLGQTEVAGDTHAGFSVNWEYRSPNYDTATRRVHIDVSTVFGSTEITGGR